MNYNETEVERFKTWLAEMKDASEYEYGRFEIAPGVTIECDWPQEYDEWSMIVDVFVHDEGFDLFTRSHTDTLSDTGAYGHGENHGDTIGADIEAWIARNFTDQFDEIIFEFAKNINGNAWVFAGAVPNPNATE